LSNKIASNSKSVEYRLHIKKGTPAKPRISNQCLITGFSVTREIKGLTARIAYQEFTNWEILIALFVAILGGAAKLFVFCPSH
jgi:hypothetical protein